MKKIGIIGGLSAASSLIYYEKLCRLTQEILGGLHAPDIILRSLNFAPIAHLMHENEWEQIGGILHHEAFQLQQSRCDFLILASNTMHKMETLMMNNIHIPLLHIAQATAEALKQEGFQKPAFLATKFTMAETFYTDKLREYNVQPIIPTTAQQEVINSIIFDELCQNIITKQSQDILLNIIQALHMRGADSVILGCTELCLSVNDNNCNLAVFDTTDIHCRAAIKMMLSTDQSQQLKSSS